MSAISTNFSKRLVSDTECLWLSAVFKASYLFDDGGKTIISILDSQLFGGSEATVTQYFVF